MLKKVFFIVLLLPTILIGQHTIKGTFSPSGEYEWVILYRVSPSLMYYTVDTTIDSEGKFEMKLDSTVKKGVYKLVYGVPQETFNFDLVYNGEEDIELAFNAKDGVEFVVSNENKLWNEFQKKEQDLDTQIMSAYQEDDSKKVKHLFRLRQKLQESYEQDSENDYVHEFIKASEGYIPKKNESLSEYTAHRMKSFFDAIDLTNSTIQNSSFLLDKTYKYLSIFQTKDETSVVDDVVEFLKSGDQKLQKGVQYGLWMKLVEANELATANYLAESSLIPLSKSLKDEIMVETLTVFKNTTIGTMPPNFSWEIEKDKEVIKENLYDLDVAENYILVFWSSSCSHCLKEIPKLHDAIKKLGKEKYKVIAIGLEDEPGQWKSETYYYPEFIHVLGLGKWENKIGNDYGISATPSYFVLDKDKKLTNKPEELSDLMKLLE